MVPVDNRYGYKNKCSNITGRPKQSFETLGWLTVEVYYDISRPYDLLVSLSVVPGQTQWASIYRTYRKSVLTKSKAVTFGFKHNGRITTTLFNRVWTINSVRLYIRECEDLRSSDFSSTVFPVRGRLTRPFLEKECKKSRAIVDRKESNTVVIVTRSETGIEVYRKKGHLTNNKV